MADLNFKGKLLSVEWELSMSSQIIRFRPISRHGSDIAKEDFKITLFEPRHVISNNVVCATSKNSDQPAHTRSLNRAFACRLHIL